MKVTIFLMGCLQSNVNWSRKKIISFILNAEKILAFLINYEEDITFWEQDLRKITYLLDKESSIPLL